MTHSSCQYHSRFIINHWEAVSLKMPCSELVTTCQDFPFAVCIDAYIAEVGGKVLDLQTIYDGILHLSEWKNCR